VQFVLAAPALYHFRKRDKALAARGVDGRKTASHKLKRDFSAAEVQSLARRAQLNLKKVPVSEFRQGLKVEREHADVLKGSETTLARVAAAHLKERPDYYTMLRKVEHGKSAALTGWRRALAIGGAAGSLLGAGQARADPVSDAWGKMTPVSRQQYFKSTTPEKRQALLHSLKTTTYKSPNSAAVDNMKKMIRK
jgi:hypothetical protein